MVSKYDGIAPYVPLKNSDLWPSFAAALGLDKRGKQKQMKLQKTYVIQTYNFLRGWEDRQQDFGGLMQVMHYTQKREARRVAANVMAHARKHKVGCWMRVVRRELNPVSLGNGRTVETTWEDCYTPNGQCSDCGSILRLVMNTNGDNGFGRMVLPEHITVHGVRCTCPNFAISDF